MALIGCNSVQNEYLRRVQMSYSLEFYTTNNKQDFLVISLVLRKKKELQIIISAKLLRPNVSIDAFKCLYSVYKRKPGGKGLKNRNKCICLFCHSKYFY